MATRRSWKKKGEKQRRRDWEVMRIRYLMGENTQTITREHGIDNANLFREKRAKNWGEHGELSQTMEQLNKEIKELESYKKVMKMLNLGEEYKEALDTGVNMEALLRNCTNVLSLKSISSLSQTLNQYDNTTRESKKFTYVKSTGNSGESYGLTSEILRNIAPLIAELNKVASLSNNVLSNQSNNNSDNDNDPIKIYIPKNNR